MKRYAFKYAAELTRRGVIHRPIAHVYLQSKRGGWFLFYPYVDSGADVSLFTRSDAELLNLELGEGQYRPIMGIGKVMLPTYIHKARMKIGDLQFDANVAFANSDEVPRLIGRETIFKKFKITFDEAKLQTVFETYE